MRLIHTWFVRKVRVHHLYFQQKNEYIEDIQVFGVNMSFISLSEVKIFYIS